MPLPRFVLLAALILGPALLRGAEADWIPLYNGRSLDGWRASENPGTFKVVDGVIVAHGKRSHLYYTGPVHDAVFQDFELRAEVRTKPGANSGIYFHTRYQETGWPEKGYEIQINNTQSDWRRTGSLYAIHDVRESPVKDNEWFTVRIRVKGQRITAWINDQEIIDYIEPANPERDAERAGALLDRGTFCLQGHDPGSEVHFRNIAVRVLD